MGTFRIYLILLDLSHIFNIISPHLPLIIIQPLNTLLSLSLSNSVPSLLSHAIRAHFVSSLIPGGISIFLEHKPYCVPLSLHQLSVLPLDKEKGKGLERYCLEVHPPGIGDGLGLRSAQATGMTTFYKRRV